MDVLDRYPTVPNIISNCSQLSPEAGFLAKTFKMSGQISGPFPKNALKALLQKPQGLAIHGMRERK